MFLWYLHCGFKGHLLSEMHAKELMDRTTEFPKLCLFHNLRGGKDETGVEINFPTS